MSLSCAVLEILPLICQNLKTLHDPENIHFGGKVYHAYASIRHNLDEHQWNA